MATFYKVVTRITDRGARIFHAGEVEARKRPENTCTEFLLEDIYEDFFLTFEDADMFVRTQRKAL